MLVWKGMFNMHIWLWWFCVHILWPYSVYGVCYYQVEWQLYVTHLFLSLWLEVWPWAHQLILWARPMVHSLLVSAKESSLPLAMLCYCEWYNEKCIWDPCIMNIAYLFTQPFLEKHLKIQDTCGVHSWHTMLGILGGVIGTITAITASEICYFQKCFASLNYLCFYNFKHKRWILVSCLNTVLSFYQIHSNHWFYERICKKNSGNPGSPSGSRSVCGCYHGTWKKSTVCNSL